jgi:2-succinyl-5-enolpyruvyl-6-hydroxy-3-cyclohexene-1-carboxylate synthase
MRACAAGQAIDQQKLYGDHVNYFHELAVPGVTLGLLQYVRQTVVQAFERTQFPSAGPVHLNVPFRDPLPPVEDGLAEKLRPALDPGTFFEHLEPATAGGGASHGPPARADAVESGAGLVLTLPDRLRRSRGVIVAGPAQPSDPAAYCAAVTRLSAVTGWPVLTDGLNPLRCRPSQDCVLVANPNAVLRSPRLAEQLRPEVVVSLGDWPASKQLRSWLEGADAETWVIAAGARNHDALHGRTVHVRSAVEAFAAGLPANRREPAAYAADWLRADRAAGEAIDRRLSTIDFLFEGNASWLLSQHLPLRTPLFVANSMPVRNVDFFWKAVARDCAVSFNRGANGIDGTLSTALGVAHGNRPAVLLTGDLALLHDTNGFLLGRKLRGGLTVVLINNHGGGIFEMLPVAKFEPPFEEFFATPQEVDFGRLCSAYGAGHVVVRDWAHFTELVSALPENGIRVIEVQTDRRRDAALCREILGAAAQAAESAV